jgi:hypothetical protein
MQNDAGSRVIDWLLISIERPDVMSANQGMAASMYANLLSGIAYWYCFSGLMLLYIVSMDFKEISGRVSFGQNTIKSLEILQIGDAIVSGIFRCAVFALLASIGIRKYCALVDPRRQRLDEWSRWFLDLVRQEPICINNELLRYVHSGFRVFLMRITNSGLSPQSPHCRTRWEPRQHRSGGCRHQKDDDQLVESSKRHPSACRQLLADRSFHRLFCVAPFELLSGCLLRCCITGFPS